MNSRRLISAVQIFEGKTITIRDGMEPVLPVAADVPSGLEDGLDKGIVSKLLSAPYPSGPSRDWLKVKNPDSPAMIRAREADWS
jgi:hypothetical protein